MSYLDEFQHLLEGEKLSPFLKLWEEYCLADQVDAEELYSVLKHIKDSHFAVSFGPFAETALPLWEKIEAADAAGNVLRLILDLQTTNTQLLADLATQYLEEHYAQMESFGEKMRIVGLRQRVKFQGAITNFELLCHMSVGKFVFHTGGWGVGEVMEASLLQEHVLIEFEGIDALKGLSFENAFKTLIYLPSDHFLARRFGDPDTLEAEGKENPVELVQLMLRDLGPKTAVEIKEELCELVIPEEDWGKWWQQTRAKLKKDTKIKPPKSAKEPFELRDQDLSHDVRFSEALKESKNATELIATVYHFVRDFPETLKNSELKQLIQEKLEVAQEGEPLKVQAAFLLEDIFPSEYKEAASAVVQAIEHPEEVIRAIDILAFKKRFLVTIHAVSEGWEELFQHLLFVVEQNALRDYIFKELSSERVEGKIKDLLHNMTLYPEAFFWYFQKVTTKPDVPYATAEGKRQFLEALLILLHYIEDKEEMRDLSKKIYNLLIGKRYAIVRELIEGASTTFLNEFLLLASKCQIFTKQDRRILRSLCEVVQPSLASKVEEVEDIIWTTAEGYRWLQERIHEIGNREMIDNAKEIEEARAHGDLRENAEYKYALERRSRLQGELQTLTRQLNKARVLTKEDIYTDQVGPGAIVDLSNPAGEKKSYTLLGPWDADPDQSILSFQSKFAQAMLGHKEGESFDFQGQEYSIAGIKSFL